MRNRTNVFQSPEVSHAYIMHKSALWKVLRDKRLGSGFILTYMTMYVCLFIILGRTCRINLPIIDMLSSTGFMFSAFRNKIQPHVYQPKSVAHLLMLLSLAHNSYATLLSLTTECWVRWWEEKRTEFSIVYAKQITSFFIQPWEGNRGSLLRTSDGGKVDFFVAVCS